MSALALSAVVGLGQIYVAYITHAAVVQQANTQKMQTLPFISFNIDSSKGAMFWTNLGFGVGVVYNLHMAYEDEAVNIGIEDSLVDRHQMALGFLSRVLVKKGIGDRIPASTQDVTIKVNNPLPWVGTTGEMPLFEISSERDPISTNDALDFFRSIYMRACYTDVTGFITAKVINTTIEYDLAGCGPPPKSMMLR